MCHGRAGRFWCPCSLHLWSTEVRNYICDECGQTFKQRKHLLVHQMRHSGAKPLQ